jgi:hypothetical protein
VQPIDILEDEFRPVLLIENGAAANPLNEYNALDPEPTTPITPLNSS